jgi:hypothetical protein
VSGFEATIEVEVKFPDNKPRETDLKISAGQKVDFNNEVDGSKLAENSTRLEAKTSPKGKYSFKVNFFSCHATKVEITVKVSDNVSTKCTIEYELFGGERYV